MSSILQRTLPLLSSAALTLGLASTAIGAQQPPTDHQSHAEHRAPWSSEVVELTESLAVQDGGRIKPLHTYAGFTLLRLHGSRSLKTPEGERLAPIEWLLDTLFFPELAASYPVFIVQNDEVIHSIGLPHEGKRRRDRYSYDELHPGIPRLFQLAREYGAIEEKNRTTVQQQLYVLAMNVDSYGVLLHHLDFARLRLAVPPDGELSQLFGGRTVVRYSDVVANLPALNALYQRLSVSGEAPDQLRAAAGMLQSCSETAQTSGRLALLPPTTGLDVEEAWHSPQDLFEGAFAGDVAPEHIQLLAQLERMADQRTSPAEFTAELSSFHSLATGLAKARGEYGKVGLELTYYKAQLISYSLYVFVLGFLLLAFSWLRPRSRVLYGSAAGAAVVSTLLLVAAITLRCMIRGRPPVSTLYETVLFVTAVGAIVALFTELINRQRMALSAAIALGVIGLFLANGYEMLDKRDTMPSLVAVLDTNFWLATHVTSITIGYSAGMLAALLASAYLLGKLVGWRRADKKTYKSLARMVYGVLAFGLIFSVVGTILGGIWANDSWGRFWGWDPKENGALLIVISQIVILHARMGGYLRDHTLCMAAAFGGTIVAFSWWGVNLLGVGLHSYGFTSGISKALWIYYGIQWGIVGTGFLTAYLEAARSRVKDPAKMAPRATSPTRHGSGATA